jgi:5'(3')-deoxyribonucleotidase
MRIGVDLDSVLADLTLAMVYVWNSEHPSQRIENKDWDCWHMETKLGISRSEFYRILTRAWSNWGHMPLMEPDVAASMKRLRRLGPVSIVSNRSGNTHHYVAQWLVSNGIPYDALVLDGSSPASKWDYPIDVLVDDNPKHALDIPAGKVLYLRSHPWNQEVPPHHRIVRVATLAEAVTRLQEEGDHAYYSNTHSDPTHPRKDSGACP